MRPHQGSGDISEVAYAQTSIPSTGRADRLGQPIQTTRPNTQVGATSPRSPTLEIQNRPPVGLTVPGQPIQTTRPKITRLPRPASGTQPRGKIKHSKLKIPARPLRAPFVAQRGLSRLSEVGLIPSAYFRRRTIATPPKPITRSEKAEGSGTLATRNPAL